MRRLIGICLLGSGKPNLDGVEIAMMGIEIGSKTLSLDGVVVIGTMGTGRGIMTLGEAVTDMMGGIGIVVIETRVEIGIGTETGIETIVDDVVGRGAETGTAMPRRPGIETGTGTGTCAEADGRLVFPRGEATETGIGTGIVIGIGTAEEIGIATGIGTAATELEVQPLGDGAAGREAASSAPPNPILTVIWCGLPLTIEGGRCRVYV